MSFPDHEKIIIPNCAEISIRDGIVYVVHDDGAEIDIERMKEMHVAYLRITNGKKMPFLFTTSGAFWISNEARSYARQIESQQPFSAIASLIDSLSMRLMAEFYGKFYKPEIPYKVFANETDALDWLQQFKTI